MQIHCVFDQPSILGESPLWDSQRQLLYWVDVIGKTIHCLDPKSNVHRTWRMPAEISAICLQTNGGLIVALRTGFAAVNLQTSEVIMLNEVIKQPSLMFNNGKCDRKGRFWAGTKDVLEESSTGILYRFDNDTSCYEMARGFIATGGIAWSPDNSILYVCDPFARSIYQCDYHHLTGTIKDQKLFAKTPKDAGLPLGLTVDSEGFLWSVHWDGWRVTRYAPSREIDSIYTMPIQRPTGCCFGGPDLSTLYVTSARIDLSKHDLEEGPGAGCVFGIDTKVTGLPEPAWG